MHTNALRVCRKPICNNAFLSEASSIALMAKERSHVSCVLIVNNQDHLVQQLWLNSTRSWDVRENLAWAKSLSGGYQESRITELSSKRQKYFLIWVTSTLALTPTSTTFDYDSNYLWLTIICRGRSEYCWIILATKCLFVSFSVF